MLGRGRQEIRGKTIKELSACTETIFPGSEK